MSTSAQALLELERRFTACLAAGATAAALEALDAILRAVPGHGGAWFNRGIVLRSLGRPHDAVAALDRALELVPGEPSFRAERAAARRECGALAEALADIDAALAVAPARADLWNTRAVLLLDTGRREEAIAACCAALERDPGLAEAANNWGVALYALGDTPAALTRFEAALALEPGHAAAGLNRGRALFRLGRLEEAVGAFRSVLERVPGQPDAAVGCGNALQRLGRTDEAVALFEVVYALGAARAGRDTWAQAVNGLVSADQHRGRWQRFEALRADVLAIAAAGGELSPLVTLLLADDPALQRRVGATFAAARAPAPAARRPPSAAGRPLRIGYLSADYGEHPVGYLIAGVMERHDRAAVRLTALALSPPADGPTAMRIRAACDEVVDLTRQSDEAAARTIEGLGIDVLVDLGGYTTGARIGIVARRPAAVVLSYLGYAASSGAACVDYLIADRWVVPAAERDTVSESLLLLPGCYLPFDDGAAGVGELAPARAAEQLPADGRVLIATNPQKFVPQVWDTWMHVLTQLDDAVLWIFSGTAAVDGLREAARRRDVDPGRLVFARRVDSRAAHCRRIALADLMLDTYPYNAHATAIDALAAAVPLVTLSGRGIASRIGGSLLHAAGLGGCVTATLPDYERRVLELATDGEERARLRAALRARPGRAPLFDLDGHCRALEEGYRRCAAAGADGAARADIDLATTRAGAGGAC